MNQEDPFDEAVTRCCEIDDRYDPEAYYFLREGLDRAMAAVTPPGHPPRHVTGQQLCAVLRDYALSEFGPLAGLVLNEWNIHSTDDFGNLVYNLIDVGIFSKSPTDDRESFHDVYNFEETFEKPYLPL